MTSTSKQLQSAARRARIRDGKVKPIDVMRRKRRLRQQAEERALSATLPDGTSPRLRANLIAANRRHAEDPEVQKRIKHAQTARRVQMAKREAGITDQGPPKTFMGMDEKQWEQEVANSLPPPIKAMRQKAKK